MKRLFLAIYDFIGSRIRSIIHWTSLLLIGVGLGWWIHPGAGLMTMGLILLLLGIWGKWLAIRGSAADA